MRGVIVCLLCVLFQVMFLIAYRKRSLVLRFLDWTDSPNFQRAIWGVLGIGIAILLGTISSGCSAAHVPDCSTAVICPYEDCECVTDSDCPPDWYCELDGYCRLPEPRTGAMYVVADWKWQANPLRSITGIRPSDSCNWTGRDLDISIAREGYSLEFHGSTLDYSLTVTEGESVGEFSESICDNLNIVPMSDFTTGEPVITMVAYCPGLSGHPDRPAYVTVFSCPGL